MANAGGAERGKMPVGQKSGSGSSGADGMSKVPGGSAVKSNGPRGGKAVSNGTSAPLPRGR